jgi:hypothetical protein
LFFSLFDVLGDYSTPLTKTAAHFIKDLVITSFTNYRPLYDAVKWEGFVERMDSGSTPAQLYLALHALPPEYVSPALRETITQGLESTPFRDEAAQVLAVP